MGNVKSVGTFPASIASNPQNTFGGHHHTSSKSATSTTSGTRSCLATGGRLKRKSKNETRARQERGWNEVARIVGAGLFELPSSLKNGLYRLHRELSDAEVVLAFARCRAWYAKAKVAGYGECECGCKTRRSISAVNSQGQSVWCLDHDKRTRLFRGVLYQQCNVEIGIGDMRRKMAHAGYALAHESRSPEETAWSRDRDDFQTAGAFED